MLKTSLVTGANKGIGYEIAKGLLKSKKFRVILACRSEELANKAAAQLAAETNSPVDNIMVLANFDLANAESIKAAAAKLASQTPPQQLDVLINNAGFAFTFDATEPTGVQARVTVGINYFGTKEVCKHFIPLVKDGGRVINVSSRAGLIKNIRNKELQQLFIDAPEKLTLPQLDEIMHKYIELAQSSDDKHIEAGWPYTTYQTSKIAESALTRILAADPENKKRGLKINCMTPGYCQTDMTRWAEDSHRTAAQGAETVLFLALDEEGAGATMNGQFVDEEQQAASYFDGSKL